MQPKARMTFRFDPPPAADRQEPSARIDDPSDLEAIIRATGGLPQGERPALLLAENAEVDELNPQEDGSSIVASFAGGQAETGHDRLDEDQMTFAGMRSRKEDGPSWWKLFVSAASAIATGALLGYLILTLFAGGASGTERTGVQAGDPAVAARLPAATSPAVEDDVPIQSGTADPAWERWPTQTYYWLQYGAYRSEEAMDAAANELKEYGLPGFGDRSEGFRAYAGVATSKADAERLAGQMPGREIYVKEIVSEAVRVDKTAYPDGTSDFVARSHRLARELVELSVNALQDAMPQAIGPENLQALRDSYSQWIAASNIVAMLDEPVRSQGTAMAEALQAAMSAVDRYEEKVSRYHLWHIQSEMMNFLAAERTFRSLVLSAAGENAG